MSETWSFLRNVLMQGDAIGKDYAAGNHKDYEEYSARVDAAARERDAELAALLRSRQTAEEQIASAQVDLDPVERTALNAALQATIDEAPPEATGARAITVMDQEMLGAPVEPQGWQPIETAPKGRNVLVAYQNKLGKWRIVRACYYEAGTLEAAEESDDFDEDGYASPGWREECETNDYIHQVEGEPLYWHPLPSAPVTKGDSRG